MLEKAKLGPVTVQLVYQTPEVYSTDIGKRKSLGSRFVCKMPKPYNPALAAMAKKGGGRHPTIIFARDDEYELSVPPGAKVGPDKGPPLQVVNIRMEEPKTHEVLWDADYRVVPWINGRRAVPGFLPAIPGSTRKGWSPLCLHADDDRKHQLEITIRGADGAHWDGMTPLGLRQGLRRGDAVAAHIGVDIMRFPVLRMWAAQRARLARRGPSTGLQDVTDSNPYRVDPAASEEVWHQVVGQGGSYGGPIYPTTQERWLAGVKEPGWPVGLLPPADVSYYYHYMHDGMKFGVAYLRDLAPPNLFSTPSDVDMPDKFPLRTRLDTW